MVKHHYTADAKTTVTSASYDDFKTGLTKVIIGITFKKFKRLGSPFYQTKAFNTTVTEEFCNTLYRELARSAELIGVSSEELSATTSFVMEWDEVGRLEGISDIKMSIYRPEGELVVDSTRINQRSERVQIDFFSSDIDASTPTVRDSLEKIKNASSAEINIIEHNVSTEEGKKTAQLNKVQKVPSVIINRELPALQNPGQTLLFEKINNALKPEVALVNPEFRPIRTAQHTLIKNETET